MNAFTELAVSDVLSGIMRSGRNLLLRSKQSECCFWRAGISSASSFMHRDLKIIKAKPEQMRKKPGPDTELIFGHQFSDHMLEIPLFAVGTNETCCKALRLSHQTITWSAEKGWSQPVISPLHDLTLHPAAKVLHYAVELFEGMKAYRSVDNKILLFRPNKNMERMYRSAIRSALPVFDTEELTKLISDLVKLDADWVPKSPSSLYIRPTLIATDPTLGVVHPQQALLYVLTGPVGQYYPTGFRPISLYADPDFCRAFPGGVGQYKMGCNYAPTMLISKIAAAKNCQQALWLYGPDQRVTEVGAMNIFMYWKNEQGEKELLTAPLYDGLILPGVTRDSVLHFARQMPEIKVTERYVRMGEIRRAVKEKRMLEVFGTGTACVVSPVDRILYKNNATGDFEELTIPTMTNEPNLMQKFFKMVVDVQYGRTKMPEWIREVV